MKSSADVDKYLAPFTGELGERLRLMRSIVRELVPEAEESFSYGLVGYKLGGKPLVYFGGFAKHVGVYATPNGHEKFKQEFAPYKQGKGSVQLPLDQPLPVDLVKRIVIYRKQVLGG